MAHKPDFKAYQLDSDEIRKEWIVNSLYIQSLTKKVVKGEATPKEVQRDIETRLLMDIWLGLTDKRRKKTTYDQIKKQGLFRELNRASRLGDDFRDEVALHMRDLSRACIAAGNDRRAALVLLDMALEIQVSGAVSQTLRQERETLVAGIRKQRGGKRQRRKARSAKKFSVILKCISTFPARLLTRNKRIDNR